MVHKASPVKLVHFPTNKLRAYAPNIEINFTRRNYLVKTVDCYAELKKVMHLRHEVFYREWLSKRTALQMDYDKFDREADHLAVFDLETMECVGTYRMVIGNRHSSYYSQEEFDINLNSIPATTFLEIGRACVAREFRNGTVLSLLWRGIVQYILKSNVDVTFGTSSILTRSQAVASAIYEHFIFQGKINFDIDCSPKNANYDYYRSLALPEDPPIQKFIPPLLNLYLEAGAKIAGLPYYDKSFGCYDFLTFLNTKDIRPDLIRRYQT